MLGALCCPGLAQAASVTVTKTGDSDDGACTPSLCSLRDAIRYSTADTVVLPARSAHYRVAAGAIRVGRPVTVQGAGADVSAIDAESTGEHRVFELTAFGGAPAATVAFRGVTIMGAQATEAPGGAGIYVEPGGPNLLLRNSVVSHNRVYMTADVTSDHNGGAGIHNAATSSTRLLGTRVAGNNFYFEQSGPGCCNGGGGVYSEGPLEIGAGSSVEGNNVTMQDPYSAQVYASPFSGGGGVYQDSAAETNIWNSRIVANKANVAEAACCQGGGGIYLHGLGRSASTTLTNVNIEGNGVSVYAPADNSSSHGGGGIYTTGGIEMTGGTLKGNFASVTAGDCCHGGGAAYIHTTTAPSRFTRVTLAGNKALLEGDGCCLGGGAIHLHTLSAPFAVRRSLLRFNRAYIAGGATTSGGGAVHEHTGSKHAIDYVNSTISDNAATAGWSDEVGGGGLFSLNQPTAVTRLANVTLAGNSAPIGGGVLSSSSVVRAKNSIVAANRAPVGRNCGAVTTGPGSPSPRVVSFGHNLEDAPASCPFGAAGDRLVPRGRVRLARLADNGGPTLTRALLAGSPAIGGGDPAGCRAFSGSLLPMDQRGVPRPFGRRCDIGAFEAQLPRVGGRPQRP